ncbi:hypothetical protein DI272_14175 [Streptomyces sp. Act143]|uniref:hypothetical protein n=1 Tax=Streptomyces sp. Act143 TaxID=2200760 RepID=UPI000D67E816|nr:hypothetical protein [Streptomyces sp. Act143]PWI15187.1 hypothetical protein DI272_14175 [Streptomyces sp. Act143]
MPFRKTALPLALVALTLTAGCGGGDDGVDAKSPAKSSPSATEALAPGESVTGKVAEDPGTVTYTIAARKVDVGTEAEALKAVSEPAKAKGLVLATAHVTYTHQGGPALTDSPEVGDGTTLFADGQRGAILIGAAEDAAGCEDPYDVESWKEGESHTFCETYLVPAHARNVEVHWSEKDDEPYVWAFPQA